MRDLKEIFDFLIKSVKQIHDVGIIHRDIKPENILSKQGRFVLADFGIASYNPEIFNLRAVTKSSERIGNRLFSAPEQEESKIIPDKTMDIYAIGQVLQWYVTGKTHRGTRRERISLTLPGLELYDDIIEKCLHNSPSERFQDVLDITQYVKGRLTVQEENPFDWLYPFDEICRSNFPKVAQGVSHSNTAKKIDRLFNSILKESDEFLKKLWWIGEGNMFFQKIEKISETVWQINQTEYSIEEVWVYQSPSIQSDFIIFRHKAGIPFVLDGEEHFYVTIVDDKHIVSGNEAYNGYAEIDDDIVNLSEHKTKSVYRKNKPGYVLIATAYNNAVYDGNENILRAFFKLTNSRRVLSIEQVEEFEEKLKLVHPDVRRHF